MAADPVPDLEALLEQCLLALESGDRDAVDSLLAHHPEAAPRLRAQLDRLAQLGILESHTASHEPPEQLGDFRLIRPIGRGGMGIVYLAEQISLHREVALKLVHPEQRFFPGARERFRREVLAVGRLQHPGIVPVLTCGEAEGVPFYAMERVVGASLAEVLHELHGQAAPELDGAALGQALARALAKKQLPTDLRQAPVFSGDWPSVCCRLTLAAATALQHAHEHGVLHRDVKPSNLLLTATGEVRVIDFGLAAAEGEQRITRSGAAFGSLPYMAPEQVRGQVSQIGPRTDVYGLGVTLYELLTLTLPHGDGSGTTRERILQGHAEPPARRNPRVQADADAICLLALDPDPGRRYPSMAAFAADLRAFLEQRTVRARRPSTGLRVKRWAARHPARAAATAVAVLLLGPVPLGFALQQHFAAARLQLALDDAKAQRHRAEQLQAAAEQSLDQALTAVDRMLFRTATRELHDHPRTMKLRRTLLEDAVVLYEQMLASAPDGRGQERVEFDRAITETRLARLCTELGDPVRATDLHRQAIARLETALPHATGNAAQRIRHELLLAHQHLAEALGRRDDFDGQIAAAEQAAREASELLAMRPGHQATAALRRDIWLSLATALSRRQATERGLELLRAVEAEVAGPPPEDLGPDPARDWLLCRVHAADNRGILLVAAGDTAAARSA
ncbi:MAG: serine/threonine protein kinase, partial [Planctomycetes bacterium]|nr:serine/threonine protein kinase [Planctomycetota bacterium]